MRVLPPGEDVGDERPEAGEMDGPARVSGEAHRPLHPGVGGSDEEAGDEGADGYSQAGQPVHEGRDALLAEEEDAEQAGLEEEGEPAFQSKGLADNTAGKAREGSPVGPELELEGYAGDDTGGEVDGKDAGPEVDGTAVFF